VVGRDRRLRRVRVRPRSSSESACPGFTFTGNEWRALDAPPATLLAEADAMHALLVLRADKLGGCTEGSEEETELRLITDRIGG
jgi:hypothetical protein